MKHLLQFLFGALLICSAVVAMCAGCSTMRRALYDEKTLTVTGSNGVVRSYTELTPKAAVEDAVQHTGGLLGPYGVAGAGLTLSILSIVAHALNARQRRGAEREGASLKQDRAGP